jgi:hypothetical protein
LPVDSDTHSFGWVVSLSLGEALETLGLLANDALELVDLCGGAFGTGDFDLGLIAATRIVDVVTDSSKLFLREVLFALCNLPLATALATEPIKYCE